MYGENQVLKEKSQVRKGLYFYLQRKKKVKEKRKNFKIIKPIWVHKTGYCLGEIKDRVV